MTSEQEQPTDFFTNLNEELRDLWRLSRFGWTRFWADLNNQMRRMRQPKIDYVILQLAGPVQERDAPPKSFWERQLPLGNERVLSVQTITRTFRKLAEADNVHGVLLVMRNIGGGLATLQSIRQAMLQLREAGKQVVVYTPFLTTGQYFVASAADKIVIPPSAQFDALGFYGEVSFYKELLDKVGIAFEGFQISPYKTAVDPFAKADLSPEFAEMMGWLFDERYRLFVEAVAEGRGLAPEAVEALINEAPIYAADAVAKGLVDFVGYEDQLEELLAAVADAEEESGEDGVAETAVSTHVSDEADSEPETENEPDSPKEKLIFMKWSEAAPLLVRQPKRKTAKYIGVVSLEGAIMPGKSQNPPVDIPVPIVGGQTAGDLTLNAILRRAEKDEQMAALLFHVDSPGGSALASDLIARDIERIAKKKPVVVYMADTAASGGYYVSALADHIVCQAGTITGSIGVVSGMPTVEKLNEKLGINVFQFKRGENADMLSTAKSLDEDRKELFSDNIREIYRQFKEIVARGRGLPFDELDEICLGRVWTGRQALGHGLVDSLGNFEDAVQKASELAELEPDEQTAVSVINLYGKNASYTFPQSGETAVYLAHLFSKENLKQWVSQPLLLLPFKVD